MREWEDWGLGSRMQPDDADQISRTAAQGGA